MAPLECWAPLGHCGSQQLALLEDTERLQTLSLQPARSEPNDPTFLVPGRKPSTVRGWCEAGKLPGAYRLRGREWRIPPAALAAIQQAEHEPVTSGGPVDLGGWRRSA